MDLDRRARFVFRSRCRPEREATEPVKRPFRFGGNTTGIESRTAWQHRAGAWKPMAGPSPSPGRRVHLCATGSAADATSAVWIGLVVNPPPARPAPPHCSPEAPTGRPGTGAPVHSGPTSRSCHTADTVRVGPLFVERDRHQPDLLGAQTRPTRPSHPAQKRIAYRRRSNQPRRRRGSNEGTCPLPPHDQALMLELGVGLHHRVGVDGQRIDDLPERRKPPRDSTGPV